MSTIDLLSTAMYRQPISIQQELAGMCYAYAFRDPSVSQSVLKSVSQRHNWKLSITDFGLAMSKDGEFLRDSKVVLWAAWHGEPQANVLTKTATKVVNRALESTKLQRHLKTLNKFPVYTVEEVANLIDWVIHHKEIEDYIGKFVKRKFAFLIRNYGLTYSGIKVDLQSAAISMLYRSFPKWKSSGEMFALSKAAIHNRGQNLIKEHTNSSKNQLITNEDGGYSLVNTTLDEASSMSTSTQNTDTIVCVRQLLNSTRFTDRQKLFLTLMTGQPNTEFSTWLGTSNADFIDKTSLKCYLSNVCRFMQIDVSVAQDFLTKLRVFF